MSDLSNDPNSVLAHTSAIVAAFVTRNQLLATDLPTLISTVHTALTGIGAPAPAVAEQARPAVSIKKSVTPEYLICLEDGKKLKMLKRHLRTTYSLTPDQYRARWNLPADYPMVAPRYAERRSEFAKKIGLGTRRSTKGRRGSARVRKNAQAAA